MSRNMRYGVGCLLLMFGGAGMSEKITSDRGIFIVSVIVFGIGFGFVLSSYRYRRSKYDIRERNVR